MFLESYPTRQPKQACGASLSLFGILYYRAQARHLYRCICAYVGLTFLTTLYGVFYLSLQVGVWFLIYPPTLIASGQSSIGKLALMLIDLDLTTSTPLARSNPPFQLDVLGVVCSGIMPFYRTQSLKALLKEVSLSNRQNRILALKCFLIILVILVKNTSVSFLRGYVTINLKPCSLQCIQLIQLLLLYPVLNLIISQVIQKNSNLSDSTSTSSRREISFIALDRLHVQHSMVIGHRTEWLIVILSMLT